MLALWTWFWKLIRTYIWLSLLYCSSMLCDNTYDKKKKKNKIIQESCYSRSCVDDCRTEILESTTSIVDTTIYSSHYDKICVLIYNTYAHVRLSHISYHRRPSLFMNFVRLSAFSGGEEISRVQQHSIVWFSSSSRYTKVSSFPISIYRLCSRIL